MPKWTGSGIMAEPSARYVIDTSALLAGLFGEPGADVLRRAGPGAVISSVTFSEFMAKCSDRNVPLDMARTHIARLGIAVSGFGETEALQAAALRAGTRFDNISFADRACLALARALALPVFTTDQQWSQLDAARDIDIRQLR